MWNWISNNPLETIAICTLAIIIMLALNIWVDSVRLKRRTIKPTTPKQTSAVDNKPDSTKLNRKNSRNFDRGNIFYRFMHRSSQSKRRKLRRKWIQ